MNKQNNPIHSRGYIPHWDVGQRTQFITFNLADSLPKRLLRQWYDEIIQNPQKSSHTKIEQIQQALDQHHGTCLLKQPGPANIMVDTLKHYENQRYKLHAWVVMPNHVHVLFTPMSGFAMSSIVQNWKSFSAHRINALLGRKGRLWEPEYFDRLIRNYKHFMEVFDYIIYNPVSAGLCTTPLDWPFVGWSPTGRW